MLELRGVRHSYAGRTVLELDAFALAPGMLTAVVGPNGSGKSTLLRLLALLERPTTGAILLDGAVVADARRRPSTRERRRVTLVEQRPVLLRGTVRDNITYGLRARRQSVAAAGRAAAAAAERLGCAGLLDRRRHELSEGEVQRVAIAGAIAIEPDVLLLDEPASAADRAGAQTLYRTLAEERARRPLAVCLASHQLEDAYRWSDDLRALADGRLSPVTPENLFRVDLPAAGADGMTHAPVGPLAIAVTAERTGPAILAVPPTDIFVSRAPLASSARNVFSGTVTRGARHRPGTVHVTADFGLELVATVTENAAQELGLAPGVAVTFAFKASAVQVF